MFGTVSPFGSNSFGSKGGGFADFSQMSKVSSGDSWSYESVHHKASFSTCAVECHVVVFTVIMNDDQIFLAIYHI